MQYTSASFASAIMNAVPPVTFVLAVILRLERVNVKEVRSLAKLIGTLVTFSGALLMTFTKVLKLSYFSLLSQPTTKMEATLLMRLSGTVFLLLGCVAWSSFFILQYHWSCHYRIGSVLCGVGQRQRLFKPHGAIITYNKAHRDTTASNFLI
ncbi:hypothetical protein GLYMA_06G111702v4 [Glycine max]|nr:hypothetical protein GLYMA_06G111702v4 [Glycine max]KAH1125330.1 hypothetical protein GYH30_014759 [Glycine max]